MTKRTCTVPDWVKIKTEYITTSISMRDSAEKWGVPFSTLRDRATKGKWAAARDKHRNTVVRKTVQKAADRQSESNANKLEKLQQAADSMSTVIADIFADAEQFKRHIVPDGDSSVDERIYKKIDTKAIKDLTGAMKDLASVMRNVYDLPTVQEQSAMDMSAERLALEKAKADAGAADTEEGGVVEIAPVLTDE